MRRAVPTLPQYAFMAWCLVKYRDDFTVLILHGPEDRPISRTT